MKKHFIFIYLSIAILIFALIANNFILTPSNSLYKYVPEESDIVIEVNAINFVKEVGYQWIYEPKHFQSDNANLESEDLSQEFKNIGINPFSKIILFNEKWANESLWFGVLKIENQDAFAKYISENSPSAIVSYLKTTAIVQISKSINQEEVTLHTQNILEGKVKSIHANPIIKTNFYTENEINIYIKSMKSEYVTDGYLSVNFNDQQIDIAGYFHPIGNTEVKPIAYNIEQNIGISLRSSLNLLNTIYLFNDTKLEYLPDYEQLAFDYDGVNLLTNNDLIPVTSFPNINFSLDILNEKTWLEYLDANIEDGSILISGDTIMINSEVKAKIRYEIANQKFQLFQKHKTLSIAEKGEDRYFALEVHPQELIDKMVFKEDENNPPKIISSQIIRIVKSVLEDFSYLNAIDEINFAINKDPKSDNYISSGHIIYENSNSHSTIESYYLFKNFIKTIGTLLN
ncbi:MAG: hypothetical protein AB8B74_11995 [Crocinitomicaceae bacterium]